MADTKKKHYGKDLSFASTEAYNLLRTNIQFTLQGNNRGQIIGITSSGPSEGKTYTAVNLACSISQLEKKVILIDGDMRKPTVGRYFEVDKKEGLSNVLVNPNVNYIQKSGINKNLDCLTSGTIPPNPSELIGSNAMKEFLLKLTEKYDYVFVDLPPVGVVSDALAVSPYLDGIICVVRHGVTRPRDLRETISRLELAKANILGFVYNAFFHRHVSPYYYRSKNRYKYYYKNYYARKHNSDSEKTEEKKTKTKKK